MFLDGGRKPDYPERTHAYTGRTYKLHTERPQVGIEPGGDGANHHTAVQPLFFNSLRKLPKIKKKYSYNSYTGSLIEFKSHLIDIQYWHI